MSLLAQRSVVPLLPVIGIAAALFALGLTAAISLASIERFKQGSSFVLHTVEVIRRIDDIAALMTDVQSAVRGFVITSKDGFLTPYRAAQRDLPLRLDELKILVADNPARAQGLATLADLAWRGMTASDALLQLRRSSADATTAMALIGEGNGDALLNSLRAQAHGMITAERQLLAQRQNESADNAARTSLLIVLGALVGAFSSGGAFLLLRAENRKRRIADQSLLDANATLTQRAGQLEITNKELESFSYSISHDLRIPLRAVSGYARMLEEDYGDKLDDEGLRLLAVIRNNGNLMGALIDDLLAFSRLGRQAMRVELIDMRAVVDRVIEQLRRDGDFTDVRIEIGTLPPACGDRVLLQQVWVNLISNALKYSATQAQPLVRIDGHEAGHELIYVIADNGVGFDMQYYGKLFGVFQRLHSADEFPGTGVGLAIAQRIITRHDGRIWAEAAPGAGATFHFAIPKQEQQHE